MSANEQLRSTATKTRSAIELMGGIAAGRASKFFTDAKAAYQANRPQTHGEAQRSDKINRTLIAATGVLAVGSAFASRLIKNIPFGTSDAERTATRQSETESATAYPTDHDTQPTLVGSTTSQTAEPLSHSAPLA